MKATPPQSIDGDRFNLVHLSNGFRVLDGAPPYTLAMSSRPKRRLLPLLVPVLERLPGTSPTREDLPSRSPLSFSTADYENTFEILQEPDYVVEYPIAASIGVLLSKEWFDLRNQSEPLAAGTSLIFRLKSEITFKNKAPYHSITVSGDVFVRGKTKRFVKVGYVDFEEEDCHGNPAVTYVHRRCRLPSQRWAHHDRLCCHHIHDPLLSNQCYSNISKDFNPIHVNPYFSDFASLPGTITHYSRNVEQCSKQEVPGVCCGEGTPRASQVVCR